MAKRVNLAVCCGGGIFTSTVVTEKVQKIAKDHGIAINLQQKKIMEIPGLTNVDLILATMKTSVENKQGAPVMIAMPLVSGMGADKFTEELVEKMKEIAEK